MFNSQNYTMETTVVSVINGSHYICTCFQWLVERLKMSCTNIGGKVQRDLGIKPGTFSNCCFCQ